MWSTSPWTMTRLVRWRVRDWASCFLACRFPLDDEEPADGSPKLAIRNTAFDMQCESRGNEGKNQSKLGHKKCSRAGRLSHNPINVKDTTSPGRPASSSHFADEEEYIVFCFNEDGSIDIVRNGKLESPATSRNSSRPVNRKLNYGGDSKAVERCSNEENLTGKACDFYPANDGKCILFDQKVESLSVGKDGNGLGTEPASGEDLPADSGESGDSNQSDGSTASFAFPVLGFEWTGSPVQMPKSETVEFRKNKHRSAGFQFQCCRF